MKAFDEFSTPALRRAWKKSSTRSRRANCPGRQAVKEFWGHVRQGSGQARGRRSSPTRSACRRGASARSAAKESCWSASAGTDFFSGATVIRSAISPRILRIRRATTPKMKSAATQYCDSCGREMIIKRGQFGTFLACTGYPDCKTTRRLVTGTKKAKAPDVPIGEKCPTCSGELLRRAGRYGDFIGCEKYPKCKYTRPITLGIKCPKCNDGEFVRRGTAKGRGRGRIFYGCSRYPDCDFTTPHEPIAEPCPKCGAPFVVEKRTKLGNFRAVHPRKLRLGSGGA